MQVSQRWRIWLGICVAVTVPLLGHDFHQIVTNPPVLNARLPSSPPTLADSRDVAVLGSNLSAQLVEVRGPVAGGYAGWTPRAETLTEIAPTDPGGRDDDSRYPGEVPAGKRACRFAVKMQGLPKDALRMTITDTQGLPNGEGALRSGDWEAHGWDTLSGWLLLPYLDATADVYAGVALASDRRILAQFPVPGAVGMTFGEKARWSASPDGWIQPITVTLPANRRPRVTSQYCLEIFELGTMGDARLHARRTVSVTPNTKQLRVDLYGPLSESQPPRAIRVTLTPFRWARFADVPVTISDAERAKINPHPITETVAQVRRAIAGSLEKSAFYEVAYADRNDLSHPQVARYVPDSVVIAPVGLPS